MCSCNYSKETPSSRHVKQISVRTLNSALTTVIHIFQLAFSFFCDAKNVTKQTIEKFSCGLLTLHNYYGSLDYSIFFPQRLLKRSLFNGKQLLLTSQDSRKANQQFQSAAHLLPGDVLETAGYKQNFLQQNAVPVLYNKVHQLDAFIRTNCLSSSITVLLKKSQYTFEFTLLCYH